MRILQPMLAAAAIGATLALSPSAFADRNAGTVVVVDFNHVFSNTAVGRDIHTKLQAVLTQMQGELRTEATALQTEQQGIETAVRGKTEAQVRADSALQQRIQTFQQHQQQLEVHQAALSRDFDYTNSQTLSDFKSQVLQGIVQQVATAHGAAVAVDSNGVFWANPNVNVTSEVETRLNQSSQTFNVTRRQAPTGQQPGAQ